MPKYNAENERLKRAYFAYLKDAKGRNPQSIDAIAAALHRFETYTNFREFRKFHIEQARGFKRHLSEQRNARTGKPLSMATMRSTLAALKAFFQWLAGRPGFKRITYDDMDYFNLSDKDDRIARTHSERPVPSVNQIRDVVASMPAGSDIERRDRAVIAFTILTGARDGAIASMRLKHVDLSRNEVHHDAREVKTKNSKSFKTWFFPVDPLFSEIVADYVAYLETELGFGPDDPLFPATKVGIGKNRRFETQGLSRKHWSNATPIRDIFRRAFSAAGMPYYNPHSFRKTLAVMGERLCGPPEEFKAWSQNLGHEHVMTTFNSYGPVASHRQSEILRKLAEPVSADDRRRDMAERILRAIDESPPLR